MGDVLIEPEPELGIATLRIAAPPVNVLSTDLWGRFGEIAEQVAADPGIRALVMWGGPRTFSVGADVRALAAMELPAFHRANRLLQRGLTALADLSVVTIAAINGYALGGGCELALAADFRYAAEDAQLGLPEVRLGIIPGSGGTQRLQRLVGLARAKDLIFTGRSVDAMEAHQVGLVDRVLPAESLLDQAREAAAKFAAGPYALGVAKRALDHGGRLQLAAGLDLEAELITRAFASQDARTGMQHFLDRSDGPAPFEGR